MSDRTIINYSVQSITRSKIEHLAENTHRSQGYVIDWIVDVFSKEHPEEFKHFFQSIPTQLTE